MAEPTENRDRFEISAFGVTMKLPTKKAAEIITVLSLVSLCLVGYMLYIHKAEASDNADEIKKVITVESNKQIDVLEKGFSRQEKLLKAMLRQNIQQTCMQQYDPKDRINKLPYCKELARQATQGD